MPTKTACSLSTTITGIAEKISNLVGKSPTYRISNIANVHNMNLSRGQPLDLLNLFPIQLYRLPLSPLSGPAEDFKKVPRKITGAATSI